MKKRLIFFFLFPLFSFAQTSDTIPPANLSTIFDFLVEKEITEITLEAEFDSILNSKKFEQYLDGIFSFIDKKNAKKNIPVKIKQRGKYRRRVCNFPPLKLKFAKKYLRALELDIKSSNLKIITHCLEDPYKSKENLLREFLAYKLYEFHSEKYFRVHLVYVKYKTPNEARHRFERYAIILEDVHLSLIHI